MCGIFGTIRNTKDNTNIIKLILRGLNLLKNRGYDSCGIYLNNIDNKKYITKFGIDGNIIKNNDYNINDIFILLEKNLDIIENPEIYNIGIGHTRWATHGGKTDYNSHPHISNDNKITIVHNGIISNYEELKKKYLSNYEFKSNTDTEVIANMIQYLRIKNSTLTTEDILKELTDILEGTWACMIHITEEPEKLYFIKNESPLLVGKNDSITILTSEPSGFLNQVDKYILLRDKTYGYVNANGEIKINGDYKELDLIKSDDNELELSSDYKHWMLKEIYDQINLSVLIDPITKISRYDQYNINLNLDFIKKEQKYLYIIGCGSSYYAALIASNYFRFTKAFEFVNVFDGGEFTRAHLESINNPEKNLLIILISQSGETRDLNIATTICREYSSNRKNKLKINKLLNDYNDLNLCSINDNSDNIEKNDNNDEIKILGIINVIGSLISRRTINNIYTNCGRENAVASTKSCTAQIISCLLLAIYKSEINNTLKEELKSKFMNDLNKLQTDIIETIGLNITIEKIARKIISKNKFNMFLLGKDELFGSALEGALKIKEIAYIHAEGFNVTALKHGPYALIEQDTPIIIIYKNRDHFIKSIIEEIKTRGAYVVEISYDCINSEDSIKLPTNRTFTGLLSVIILQLLSYHLCLLKNNDPDRPRNLAKVVTVD
jgi:glucosamine--fructose-6-phosphate aminotransferase (isomerizing)